MFAAHYNLDNLCVVFDWNGLQIDGPITEVMNPTPHDKKLEAFGFHVISIDGNDLDQIEAAFKEARTIVGKPCAIVAKTVKGKGVSFMENQVSWHGAAPKDDQYEQAVAELKATL
jgi:transketolase